MIVLMIVVLYFFMWRPESKRRKEMAKFREGLKKGDKIITAGGIYGTVKEVKDTTLLIEVDSRESQDLPPFGRAIDYMTFGGLYREVYLDIREKYCRCRQLAVAEVTIGRQILK